LTAQNNTYTMQIDRWKAFYLVSAESSINVKCVGWAVVNDNTFTVRIAQESFFFLLDVC
jgi:hypothetical protein